MKNLVARDLEVAGAPDVFSSTPRLLVVAMVDWPERARREIQKSVDRTDDRNLTAVMAVPHPAKSGNFDASNGSIGGTPEAVLSKNEETTIRAWLAHIEETDPGIIAGVMNQCRADADARTYFLGRAGEVPVPYNPPDDRRHCHQCRNLIAGGLCLVAQRGEFKGIQNLHPMDDIPRRCEGYLPRPDEPDQRTGRERWPGLS
uniref:Uncharacterized protein n=1 Tax=Candidatus Kentrum sp. FW TaxID=2126338 RepID=A0A450U0E4_9GAMM|nr:MAG: hypothetical protein BECKFW1821C_GA0114237_108514 [Candidatus Kentron sp. FW]